MMTVHFIGAGPGAADLITVRGAKLIGDCPVCLYAGSIVSPEILQYCPEGARIIDTAPMSLDEIEAEYVRAAAAGQDVARLHSGDLSVWSAVAEQHALLAAAAAALGRELTIPTVAQSLVLTRVSGRASPMPPRENLDNFGRTGATLAIHLAIHALPQVVVELLPHYGADCPVAIVVKASWPDQRILRATLATIEAQVLAEPIERTALIFVGPGLEAADFQESSLYDPAYQRRFRGRDTF